VLLGAGCGGGSAGFPRYDAPGAGVAVPDGVAPATWAQLTAELRRVLAEYPPRRASAPPDSAASAAVLDFSTEDATLNWGLYNAGDYNQDGRRVSDSPLGQHCGEESPTGKPAPAVQPRRGH
jgi:hypothetical protein